MSSAGSVLPGRLEINSLRKTFGAAAAVEDLSVKLAPGEFFTILGPSGSGKTTTLMMVAGFADPDAGSIVLDGREITNMPAHRRGIGVVFQNYAVFPHMTVAENIGFSLRMREMEAAEIRKRVARTIELVQLNGLDARYPHQLSGGQQQRVALARALVFEPSLLLFDEPLGALDRMLREDMKLELRRVHKELRTTMVYVTHDQDEALVLSDRIMVMNAGRAEQIGTPEEIYESPENPFVARFIGESNFLRGTVKAMHDGKISVDIRGLCLEGKSSQPVSIGTPVEICVRPEKIAFSSSDQPSSQHFQGLIQDRIYSGESIRYIVRVGEGISLTVKQVRRWGAPNARPGQAIKLSWNPEDAIVFNVGRQESG